MSTPAVPKRLNPDSARAIHNKKRLFTPHIPVIVAENIEYFVSNGHAKLVNNEVKCLVLNYYADLLNEEEFKKILATLTLYYCETIIDILNKPIEEIKNNAEQINYRLAKSSFHNCSLKIKRGVNFPSGYQEFVNMVKFLIEKDMEFLNERLKNLDKAKRIKAIKVYQQLKTLKKEIETGKKNLMPLFENKDFDLGKNITQ